MKRKREEAAADLAEAMFQFILQHPPVGFKSTYFQVLIMSGRLEEAAEYLKGFKWEERHTVVSVEKTE